MREICRGSDEQQENAELLKNNDYLIN